MNNAIQKNQMELTSFTFGDKPFRTVLIDGEPQFALVDLCKILNLTNPTMTAKQLEEEFLSTAEVIDSLGRPQIVRTVNESGLYQIVFMSRKEEAKAFRRWVTAEVLPSIRKTGSYGIPALTDEQIVAQALQITTAKVEALEHRVAAQSREIRAAVPKVAYIDQFVADTDLITIRTLASNLNIGEKELRDLLIRKNWIYAEEMSRWSERQQKKLTITRYSAYADKKAYFQPVLTHEAPRFKGETMHTLKVTPAGASAIARNLSRFQQPELSVAS